MRDTLSSLPLPHARPYSSVQGPLQIPTEKSEASNFNGWLCRARDVQTKRVSSISEAFAPPQGLKSSCAEDTTEVFMGKDHTQSQGDTDATARSSGHMCEGAFTSQQTELTIPHCCPRGKQGQVLKFSARLRSRPVDWEPAVLLGVRERTWTTSLAPAELRAGGLKGTPSVTGLRLFIATVTHSRTLRRDQLQSHRFSWSEPWSKHFESCSSVVSPRVWRLI